jgi:hypothetical protein
MSKAAQAQAAENGFLEQYERNGHGYFKMVW